MSSNINVCYYSRVCPLSRDLVKMMDSYGILNKFVLKCIDDMDPRKIPQQLTTVPTLLIAGIDKPLVAKEAVKWFNDNRPYFTRQSEAQQSKQIIYNMTKTMYNGPKGMSGELSGTSDEFAYCDVDEAQPKNFCKDVEDGNVIITPPMDNKIGGESQEKMIKQVEQIRKNQERDYGAEMKQDQIDRVMRIERDKLVRERLL